MLVCHLGSEWLVVHRAIKLGADKLSISEMLPSSLRTARVSQIPAFHYAAGGYK